MHQINIRAHYFNFFFKQKNMKQKSESEYYMINTFVKWRLQDTYHLQW